MGMVIEGGGMEIVMVMEGRGILRKEVQRIVENIQYEEVQSSV